MKTSKNLPTIFPVTCHTDHVGPGSAFVAIQGYKEDGIHYIPYALQKGASTIVLQVGTQLTASLKKEIKNKDAQIHYVENTRTALANLSAKALGNPTDKLKIIGITGTKGKTTTTFLVEHILKESGHKTARISSVNNTILNNTIKSSLTTPPADYLQIFFDQCVKKNIEWVVLEISAHALSLDRTAGILFDGIIFTNFESEHIEFFSTTDNYFKAKLRIFEQLKPQAPALVNADNAWCKKISSHYPFVSQFGIDNTSHDITTILDPCWEQRLSLDIPWNGHHHRLACPALLGRFNAYNILCATGLALKFGIPMETIAAALYSFKGVPGRQDKYILPNNATCIIDYAHTPASYQAILSLLREQTDHLIVIFGAGGERDKTKRPKMGAIAARYADIIILTSDNPRSENPEQIMKNITSDIPEEKKDSVLCEIDRIKAIQMAYTLSRTSSIIALLGKGVDEYQIIGKKVLPFSDKEVILSLK